MAHRQSTFMSTRKGSVTIFSAVTREDSCPCRPAGQEGFSLIEQLFTFPILVILSTTLIFVMIMLSRGTQYAITKSQLTNTARNGMELVSQRLRDEMVQFNTVAGTPLGVNFDLDESGDPVVRDALLVYIDQDHTGLMYSDDGDGNPVFAGLDDFDDDGFADVLGIGLLAQDDDGDGEQDFIDVDGDGAADDVDQDGRADKLWQLVAVRFDNMADVSTVSLWQGGRMLARNLYVKLYDPNGSLSAENIDTFSYLAKGTTALLSDSNDDGILSEVELGNLVTANAIIDDAVEVGVIDSVAITIHIVGTGARGSILTHDLSTQITPRAIELFRINGIVGLADASDATQID